jgi:8-oxo-dGTP pyrophosphatase MutT (NUDIX family)
MGENEQADSTPAALAALRQALDDAADMPPGPARTAAVKHLAAELQHLYGISTALRKAEVLRLREAGPRLSLAEIGERVGLTKARIDQILRAARAEGEPSTIPEPQPVVAAIVTSARGVLIGKRRDGKPPWTFIAGEIEPGESPADAAVREVKEETGLLVTAGKVIGRRVHPATGRTMVYMAARPVRGTEVLVGDEDELAEVRWVSVAEADALMGGMIFEPVRKHLLRRLR